VLKSSPQSAARDSGAVRIIYLLIARPVNNGAMPGRFILGVEIGRTRGSAAEVNEKTTGRGRPFHNVARTSKSADFHSLLSSNSIFGPRKMRDFVKI
jgi:hypothetical protein